MKSVKIFFVVVLGLLSLTACVGVDPHAGSRGPSGAAPAQAAIPVPLGEVEPTPRLSGIQPGDPLVVPERARASIDPVAVLAHRAPTPARTTTLAAVETPTRPAVRTAGRPAAPFLAARPEVAGASAATDLPRGATRSATAPDMTPLAAVEARAEKEQRAQAKRDQRFDAQIRRASGLVCSGCLSSAPARGRSGQAAKATTEDDE